jgi:hypothetical protein
VRARKEAFEKVREAAGGESVESEGGGRRSGEVGGKRVWVTFAVEDGSRWWG